MRHDKMLEFTRATKSFGGVKAVNECSFSIKPRVVTALIGPNGAGKTTVFNLACGLLKPDSGSITLAGTEITNLAPEAIALLGVARTFQQPRLFENLTVLENVLLAADSNDGSFWKNFVGANRVTPAKEETARKALSLAGMQLHEDALCRELSYGQKKLVELARSLAKPHQLLLLDEPVAGVNPKLRASTTRILERLRAEKKTILLTEHDLQFALGIADDVIVMDEGCVIAQGAPPAIKRNEKVLEAYLG